MGSETWFLYLRIESHGLVEQQTKAFFVLRFSRG